MKNHILSIITKLRSVRDSHVAAHVLFNKISIAFDYRGKSVLEGWVGLAKIAGLEVILKSPQVASRQQHSAARNSRSL